MKTCFIALAGLTMAAPATAMTAVGAPQAIAIAEAKTGGRAFDVETEFRGGRPFFEVKLLNNGTLHEVQIEQSTGRVAVHRQPRFKGYWSRWTDQDERVGIQAARPMGDVLTALEQRSGGSVIDANFEIEAGQPRYKVELSTAAGIAEIYLDPRTGERLSLIADD